MNEIEKESYMVLPEPEDMEKEIEEKTITLMSKFSPVPYAKILMTRTEFIFDKRKQFWRYDKLEGIWRRDAEQFIKTELRKSLMGEEQQKKYYAEEVIAYIKDINYKENFEFKKSPYLIAFKNKLFDLEKDCYLEFAPKYHIINKLDIEIKETKCPAIDKFFTECLDKDHKEILYDLAAYTMFTDYPYQKLFFIYGAPNTGKSIYLQLLEKFLGRANCSMIEPRAIQKDKHAMFKMWLKLANIVGDINYDEFDNVNQIKKLTGKDSVDIRPMYQEGFSETLYTKQIYSTNKLPAVKEKTMAWYRRLYLINFGNIVKSENVDRFLENKLTTKEELEGFAFQCLEHLRELYKNNFVFTYDIDERKIPELYERLSNPTLMFIEENCKTGKEEFVFKYEFEERLNNWLKIHHFPAMTKSQINQYMREHYNESQRPAPSYDGTLNTKSYRVWTGLRWKESKDVTNFTSFTSLHTKSKDYIYNRRSLNNPVNPLSPLNPVNNTDKIDVIKISDKIETNTGSSQSPVPTLSKEVQYKVLETIKSFVNVDGSKEPEHLVGELVHFSKPIADILISENLIKEVI